MWKKAHFLQSHTHLGGFLVRFEKEKVGKIEKGTIRNRISTSFNMYTPFIIEHQSFQITTIFAHKLKRSDLVKTQTRSSFLEKPFVNLKHLPFLKKFGRTKEPSRDKKRIICIFLTIFIRSTMEISWWKHTDVEARIGWLEIEPHLIQHRKAFSQNFIINWSLKIGRVKDWMQLLRFKERVLRNFRSLKNRRHLRSTNGFTKKHRLFWYGFVRPTPNH